MIDHQPASVPMRDLMEHRGFYARLRYSHSDRAFVGRVLGVHDAMDFQGESVSALRAAFHEVLDRRLAEAERTGEPLLKPRSGRLRVRMTPALHARAASAATIAGKSLNLWGTKVIAAATA